MDGGGEEIEPNDDKDERVARGDCGTFDWNDPRRWANERIGFEALGLEALKRRAAHANATTEACLAFIKQQNKAEERYAKDLRISVGTDLVSESGWFGWGGTEKKDHKKKPTLGPDAWEGLNGILAVVAAETDREAENRIDFARNVYAELYNAISNKHRTQKAAQNDLFERHRAYEQKVKDAALRVTKAKAKFKLRVEAEIQARKKHTALMAQMDAFTERLKSKFETLSGDEQDKAAVNQIFLSRDLQRQKDRWSKCCEAVDDAQSIVSSSQVEREDARIKLANVTAEIGTALSKMELERVHMLKVAMQSVIENEKKCHAKRISHLERLGGLLRSVDANTDVRLASHNEIVKAKIAKACASSSSALSSSASSDEGTVARVARRAIASGVGSGRRSHKGPRIILPRRTLGGSSDISVRPRSRSIAPEDRAAESMIRQFVASISSSSSSSLSKDDDTDSTKKDPKDDDPPTIDADAEAVVRLFERKSARDFYIRDLNRQRSSNKSIKSHGFKALTRTMKGFLDACVAHRDIGSATMLMIMSQTFFKETKEDESIAKESGGNKDRKNIEDENESTTESSVSSKESSVASLPRGSHKEFVQRTISNHPIWKDSLFWEEAFLHIVREEVERNHASFVVHRDAHESNRLDRLRQEAEYHYKQIVFGQLGSIGISMRSFGMSLEATHAFIQKMCIANGLSDDEMESLVRITRTQEVIRRHSSSSIDLGALSHFSGPDKGEKTDLHPNDTERFDASSTDPENAISGCDVSSMLRSMRTPDSVVAIGESGSQDFFVDL